MTISEALKRIYASAPTNRRYLETLAFSHPWWTPSYFFVSDPEQWTFDLETGVTQVFEPVPFELTLPNRDGSGRADMQIAINNTGREMVAALERAMGDVRNPIEVTYRVYLDVPYRRPENDPPLLLHITSVTVSGTLTVAQATRADILNTAFPRLLFNADDFPGLLR